jgi:hypothetical protein
MDTPSITRLAWCDAELGILDFPKGRIQLRSGFGSGLTRRPGEPEGRVWAVCDRGPNIKVKEAVDRLGVEALAPHRARDGAKLMPRLDLGPALAELQVEGDTVTRLRALPLSTSSGRQISGLPLPEGPHAVQEPVFDLKGSELGTDPAGADTEGLAALADGGFWVADEYGPSLLRVDSGGVVKERLVPMGCDDALAGAGYSVQPILPSIAGRRQLNRGFEAIALAPDQRRLWLAFQSPLAHPDEEAHRHGRHVRIWRLDAVSGEVEAQFLYPLDPPHSFRRDTAKGKFGPSDIKVSEIAAVGPTTLLVLERGSETTKIYRAESGEGSSISPVHLDIGTRPTIEEASAAGELAEPVLDKQLLFTSDDAPEVAADLEGMVLLSPHDLLLASDNDFGVDGAETSFWRLTFAEPIG